MSSKTLAAHVAELLSKELQTQQVAPSTLSHYKAQKSRHNKIHSSHDLPLFASQSDLEYKPAVRRGSVASTTASGSLSDSHDGSDAASECSGPVAPRLAEDPAALSWGLRPPSSAEPVRSTLKITNIPRRCGKDELLAVIHTAGFKDAYDFFYLPIGPQSKKNHGYAFVNLRSNEAADRFTQVFQGYPVREKLLGVSLAPLQGLAQNLDHFSQTQARKVDWAPNVTLKV